MKGSVTGTNLSSLYNINEQPVCKLTARDLCYLALDFCLFVSLCCTVVTCAELPAQLRVFCSSCLIWLNNLYLQVGVGVVRGIVPLLFAKFVLLLFFLLTRERVMVNFVTTGAEKSNEPAISHFLNDIKSSDLVLWGHWSTCTCTHM